MKKLTMNVLTKLGYFAHTTETPIFHFFHFVGLKRENNKYNENLPKLILCKACWYSGEYNMYKRNCKYDFGFLIFINKYNRKCFLFNLETKTEHVFEFNGEVKIEENIEANKDVVKGDANASNTNER